MKLTNIIIVLVLSALCLFGWVMFVSDSGAQTAQFDADMRQAENCMERGLYQRAIESYQSALKSEDKEDIYLCIADAYSKRYAEAPQATYDDYFRFIKSALNSHPDNRTLLDHLIFLCLNEEEGVEDYKTLYSYLKKALARGCDDEAMVNMYARARYAYRYRSNSFQRIVDAGSGRYAVHTDLGWNVYTLSDGHQLGSNVDYVGPCNENGVAVITDGNSQLYDVSSAMVLGKFKDVVTEAGIYSEGVVPALVNGKYGYYNDYADYQFGDYDYAGTFQDGLAAVETNGTWMLVNAAGEPDRGNFERIVTDLAGHYAVDGSIVVKEAGAYHVYDSKWDRKADLACDDVDVLSKDGIIAVRSGNAWGFMDMDGNLVIEPQYAAARSFSNGLAAVQKDGKWGFIDRTGRLVIDYTFADAGYMSADGVCPVQMDTSSDGPASDTAAAAESAPETDPGTAVDLPTESWGFISLVNGITED